MALDFLKHKDNEGAALYIIYDGTHRQMQHWERFISNVKERTTHQIHLFSVKDREGERLINFYGLSHGGLPSVFIVRDNDQVAHSWSGADNITVDHVVSSLNQVSST